MNYCFTRVILTCTFTLLAAGCVQRAPYVESQMGNSLSLIKAQQVLNPNAGSNSAPVVGMEATAAKSAQDRYEQTFRTPQRQRDAFTIGIGSGR